MNKKKWIKLGLTVLLAFSLTACGTKDSGNADQSNSAVTMTAEAENAQEALSTYKKLMEQGKITAEYCQQANVAIAEKYGVSEFSI